MTKCLLFIPVFKDTDKVISMYDDLIKSDFDFDANPKALMDMSPEWERDTKIKEFCNNKGIMHLGHKDNLPEAYTETLIKAVELGCDYWFWIHSDMKFSEHPDWINELIKFMETHPKCLKACSVSYNIKDTNKDETPANSVPEMVRVKDAKEILYDVDGYFCDPNFKGVGLWGDIDINRRIRTRGKETWLVAKSKVWHDGMGNRGRFDLRKEDQMNVDYYFRKWKDTERY